MRRSSAQIDAEIVDVAARIFAVHDYERTSVQQLADATGYSKTGLLHRFGSKDQLYAAVVAEAVAATGALLDEARSGSAEPEPLRRHLALVAEAAVAHPGLLQFFIAICPPGVPEPLVPELVQPVQQLQRLFCLDDVQPVRTLRTMLALKLVMEGVVLAETLPAGTSGLAPLLADLAHRVALDPIAT